MYLWALRIISREQKAYLLESYLPGPQRDVPCELRGNQFWVDIRDETTVNLGPRTPTPKNLFIGERLAPPPGALGIPSSK